MTVLGGLCLWLAFLLGVWGALAGFVGGWQGRRDLQESARHAVFAMCATLFVAVAALEWALFQHDFNVEYVAAYTSRNLPIFYTWSALYAGQQAPLLPRVQSRPGVEDREVAARVRRDVFDVEVVLEQRPLERRDRDEEGRAHREHRVARALLQIPPPLPAAHEAGQRSPDPQQEGEPETQTAEDRHLRFGNRFVARAALREHVRRVDDAVLVEAALHDNLDRVVERIGRQPVVDHRIAGAAVGDLEAQRLRGHVTGDRPRHDPRADFHADVIKGRIHRDLLRQLTRRQEILPGLLDARRHQVPDGSDDQDGPDGELGACVHAQLYLPSARLLQGPLDGGPGRRDPGNLDGRREGIVKPDYGCLDALRQRDLGQRPPPAPDRDDGLRRAHDRSEERRVGKECRSRWSPYH